jgi:hypothetical protein
MSRSDDDLLLYGGAAFLLGLALWEGPTVVAAVQIGAGYVTNLATRGNKLADFNVDDAGVVTDDPEVLRDQAEAVLGYTADLDTFALATMGRSEGVDGMRVRMHIALNDLADLQREFGTHVYSSLAQLMLHSKVAAADGHFSEQYLGKRYATDRPPYEGDYHLAEQVIAEHAAGVDPSGGALKFVDKDSFASQRGATATYEQKVAEWAAAGLAPFNVPDATDNFVVFRRTA